MQIPMSSPDLTDDELAAVGQVLQSRYLSLGPRIERFERALASYVGAKHAVGVNSGTSGLHLAVVAAGVQEGDLVITTPFSFVASANCILYERGIPVFVDVDPVTGNTDPGLIAVAIHDLVNGGSHADRWVPGKVSASRLGRVKAILPVDVFGQPVDMDPIMETACNHGLVVIGDSCEAIGSEYKGRKAGTLGEVGVFRLLPQQADDHW